MRRRGCSPAVQRIKHPQAAASVVKATLQRSSRSSAGPATHPTVQLQASPRRGSSSGSSRSSPGLQAQVQAAPIASHPTPPPERRDRRVTSPAAKRRRHPSPPRAATVLTTQVGDGRGGYSARCARGRPAGEGAEGDHAHGAAGAPPPGEGLRGCAHRIAASPSWTTPSTSQRPPLRPCRGACPAPRPAPRVEVWCPGVPGPGLAARGVGGGWGAATKSGLAGPRLALPGPGQARPLCVPRPESAHAGTPARPVPSPPPLSVHPRDLSPPCT